jgi:hypothetical protein
LRNCLILGAGRSGTSLAAGVLSQQGYFMGTDLYSPDQGNPKGYYESWLINSINEDLLAQVISSRPRLPFSNILFRRRPPRDQRWLSCLHKRMTFKPTESITHRIETVTSQKPFCFKDPRFCYTLSVWRPFVGDPLYLCVFRDPSRTAHSLIKECQRVPDYAKFISTYSEAFCLWEAMYRYVLEVHYSQGGDWIFAHYEQFLDGSVFKRLGQALGVRLDADFADRTLSRSKAGEEIPETALVLYRRLCRLAEYRERE